MKRVCFPDRAKSAIRFGALHRESLPFLDSSKKLKKLWDGCRGRFLCMLWSRDYLEGRNLPGLRHPSAWDAAA
jgi:hypothetical protein